VFSFQRLGENVEGKGGTGDERFSVLKVNRPTVKEEIEDYKSSTGNERKKKGEEKKKWGPKE